MRVKYIRKADGERLNLPRFPNFSATGSVIGMKRKYYGMDALLVRSGAWIYNVSGEPGIYYNEAY